MAADLRMTYETCREVYLWACEYVGWVAKNLLLTTLKYVNKAKSISIEIRPNLKIPEIRTYSYQVMSEIF